MLSRIFELLLFGGLGWLFMFGQKWTKVTGDRMTQFKLAGFFFFIIAFAKANEIVHLIFKF